MLGHLGFSYIGLIWLIMLMVPNLIWTKHQPKGYSAENESRILLVFERLGEVLVSICALVFRDFNLNGFYERGIWLILSFLCMLFYEYWWFRYFRSQHTLKDFYCSLFGIPLAGALLPVTAFFLLGIYGKVVWMIIFAVILGIGHIGIHFNHAKKIKEDED